HGRCFEQDGKFFNADGEEWDPSQSPVEADNAEAALRARIEADAQKKIAAAAQAAKDAEAETRARIEAEMRAAVEAEMREKIEAEVRAKLEAEAQARAAAGGTGGSEGQNQGPMPLESLGLTARAESALKGAGFDTVEKLCTATAEQLLALPSVGETTVTAIKKALKAAGKALAG
ncbi:MAG TPA: DNA-directed RNA polymerase subunit alpha C-terminal domain-containing protein, partial [Ramlibacter sp.]|nr:DNA-directed RNA polymerase subunit alpha C-terminal domain-containing protein [Ramlibacter sp.]